jgi:hypothetical protein
MRNVWFLTAATFTVLAALAQPAATQDAQVTYRDIEQTLGSVPTFFAQMAAVVRHWSTVLNGTQVDLGGFKRDTDAVLAAAAEKAKAR